MAWRLHIAGNAESLKQVCKKGLLFFNKIGILTDIRFIERMANDFYLCREFVQQSGVISVMVGQDDLVDIA